MLAQRHKQAWVNAQETKHNIQWGSVEILPTSTCKKHLALVYQRLQGVRWYMDTLRAAVLRT